jgi:hypothetical protein
MPRQTKGFGSPEPSKTPPVPQGKVYPASLPLMDMGPIEPLAQIEARIIGIVGTKAQGAIAPVNLETLAQYQTALQAGLTPPIQLTGQEPFPWEEAHLYGKGTPAEHQSLRVTQPSYVDQFQLLRIIEAIDPVLGVMAMVQREPDADASLEALEVLLPLANFKGGDRLKVQLLEDYRYWFHHCRTQAV